MSRGSGRAERHGVGAAGIAVAIDLDDVVAAAVRRGGGDREADDALDACRQAQRRAADGRGGADRAAGSARCCW